MSKLQVIVGSTRPMRAADLVVPWVVRRSVQHGAFEVELLDLRDWPLPDFAEDVATIGDRNNPIYSDPLINRWNTKVFEADAYVVITPEYNHSIPAVLKNAMDSVFVSYAFRNKPLAAVGYSAGIAAGTRALQHLSDIAIELEMVPLRNTVLIPYVRSAFDDTTSPFDPIADVSMTVMLDDLAWWAAALSSARAKGQLLPGQERFRSAADAIRAR